MGWMRENSFRIVALWGLWLAGHSGDPSRQSNADIAEGFYRHLYLSYR